MLDFMLTSTDLVSQHHGGQLLTPEEIEKFCFAGRARFTLVSKKSGERFTYRIKEKKDKTVAFVSLLRGPDNGEDFAYMGIIVDGKFKATAASRVSPAATSHKAFVWFYEKLTQEHTVSQMLEVWHEGRCGRCGRVLTVPSSIEDSHHNGGFGPECEGKL